jgi:hypothetical protein
MRCINGSCEVGKFVKWIEEMAYLRPGGLAAIVKAVRTTPKKTIAA